MRAGQGGKGCLRALSNRPSASSFFKAKSAQERARLQSLREDLLRDARELKSDRSRMEEERRRLAGEKKKLEAEKKHQRVGI